MKQLQLIIAALILLLGIIGLGQVEIAEDALDMLPDDTGSLSSSESVRGDLQLLQKTGLVNRVFISLTVDSKLEPDQYEGALKKSADDIGSFLVKSQEFSQVIYRLEPGYEYKLFALWSYLPALLDQGDRDWLAERITEKKLKEILLENFYKLNSLAGLAVKKQIQLDPLGISSLLFTRLEHLQGEYKLSVKDGYFFSRDGKSCLIWAESPLPLTDSKVAAGLEKELKLAFEQGLSKGVMAVVIGALPHTLANARTIQNDLKILLPAASFILLFFLFFILRDLRVAFVAAIPFLAAPAAISITGLFFKQVSAMSLGFGIVLLGISVDFAIHFYLALSREPGDKNEIIARLKRPLLLAALTTIGVFVILLGSSVPSHRQMAVLAISGIFLAIILSRLLVPFLVKKKAETSINSETLNSAGRVPKQNILKAIQPTPENQEKTKWPVLIIWGLLLLAGVFSWPHIRYNGDLKGLDIADPIIMAEEKHFLSTWGQEDEYSFVLASGEDLATALAANDQVYKILLEQGIGQFQTIAPILPGRTRQKHNIKAWQDFWQENKNDLRERLNRIGGQTGFSPFAFKEFLEWLEKPCQEIEPDILLNGPLRPMLLSLLRLTENSKNEKSLPQTGINSNYNAMAVTILPENEQTRDALRTLGDEVKGVRVISNSQWKTRLEKLMKDDIFLLSSSAGILILILTWFYFRKPGPVLACLAPVLSALSAMSAFEFLLGSGLNLMHLLMGIMVIGLSVDYGIFMVCSCQGSLTKTTRLAVTVCAISSITGFGVLSMAGHPALNALGITVLVGIGAALPTALWVSPLFAGKKNQVAE
jgi:uncharacterized protein